MLRHELTLKVLKGVWAPCGEFIEVDEGYIGLILKPQKIQKKKDENRKTTMKRDENRMGQSSVKFNTKII